MPIVHIDLIAGRSQDQLKGLVKDVTAAVSKNTGAPAEHIHVILSEM
ncbi:2-hydroxymuconate tautomerase [Lactiplantibacillus dongliensis]|nr:2-hydroxymuconate tautomerase [Lactiplantibacillus dongliensis]